MQQTSHVEDSEGGSNEGKYEAELTHDELRREAEKRSEGWLRVGEQHTDREEKASRDEEVAREERVHEKDAPQKPGQKDAGKNATSRQSLPGALKKAGSDGFERLADPSKVGPGRLEKAAAVAATSALTQAPPLPRSNRPEDAMTLLHAAQEAGVFFKEDGHREGHSEDQDDPEMAAAIEEAIRLLFGVQGVLRVGPGVNDAGEQVVVIVAHRGFGEASMKAVPPMVHRFPTLVALPYELLPLRRER
jgi:hypothetical protein